MLSLAGISEALAAKSLIGLSLVPPVQIPDSDSDVTGLRLSLIFGKHMGTYGIDIGLLGNMTERKSVGLSVAGLFNRNYGETKIIGLQAAGITNINSAKATIYGFQIALVNINRQPPQKEFSSGFGAGFGTANGSDYGLEYGAVYGAQIGLYNSAAEVYGFQIGLINFVNRLHGIQIGLLNFNRDGPFAVCPFFNVGF